MWSGSQFDPQAGHEQAGHRPTLVISLAAYNGKAGLMVCCPMTTRIKGHPFEVLDGDRWRRECRSLRSGQVSRLEGSPSEEKGRGVRGRDGPRTREAQGAAAHSVRRAARARGHLPGQPENPIGENCSADSGLCGHVNDAADQNENGPWWAVFILVAAKKPARVRSGRGGESDAGQCLRTVLRLRAGSHMLARTRPARPIPVAGLEDRFAPKDVRIADATRAGHIPAAGLAHRAIARLVHAQRSPNPCLPHQHRHHIAHVPSCRTARPRPTAPPLSSLPQHP